MVRQTADNRFGPPKFIVSATASEGTHTTIQSAIDDASSGDYIFIKNGTYTENVTLADGINLVSYGTIPVTGSKPSIVGKVTISSGLAVIKGLKLTTNGDYALETTGSGSIDAYLCDVIASDHDGILWSGTASSRFYEGFIAVNTATYKGFIKSTTGDVRIRRFDGGNGGGTSATCDCTVGCCIMEYGGFPLPLATSGSGIFALLYVQIDTNYSHLVCLTTEGTGSSLVRHCVLNSGTAAALSIGTGTRVNVTQTTVNSINSNPVTGAGTLVKGSICFSNTGNGVNVSSNTVRKSLFGSISFDGTNDLSDYSEGTWTPVIQGTGTVGTASYVSAIGVYQRVGNRVSVQARVDWFSGTGTGELRIGGLPFTVTTTNYGFVGPCSGNGALAITANVDQVNCTAVVNTTQLNVTEWIYGTSLGSVAYDAAAIVIVSCEYTV